MRENETYKSIIANTISALDDEVLMSAFMDAQYRAECGLLTEGALLVLERDLHEHLCMVSISPLATLEKAICLELAIRYCKVIKSSTGGRKIEN